ncbi:MAG: hypothetical protein LZF86_230008 [Nitrospira sp.]|nr:MAG: hypothetical protein LZF86_230008 [Nitrospira sp.]
MGLVSMAVNEFHERQISNGSVHGRFMSWSLIPSHLPKGAFEKFSCEFHVLFDIGLQMSGACLPVIGGVADAAGEEDEFFGVGGREDEIFCVAAHHAQTVDQHSDKEIGLP